MSLNPVVFSRKSDHWATPKDFYAELDAEFDFTFDPCPLMSTEDGSKVQWTGRVFCNPPYSAIAEFLARGLYHLGNGDCELLVYLIPARTDAFLRGDKRLNEFVTRSVIGVELLEDRP